MSMTLHDGQAAIQASMDALRSGDPVAARHILDAAVRDGLRDPPWMLLAQCCARSGDPAGEEAALTAQLGTDKRHLPALLAMGELMARREDDRAAANWYRAALNQATVNPNLPPALFPLLERAQTFLDRVDDRFGAHLLADLSNAGIALNGAMAQAVDLLLGKTPLYLQQPSMFYYPGLPQRPFYERSEMGEWAQRVEAATPAMRAELDAVMSKHYDFDPYITPTKGRPLPNNPLLDDPRWGAWYFWKNGEHITSHADACPATMAAIADAPMPEIAGRSPMALWSRLEPGTHIQPHHGMLNTRLICHLPLLVPHDCALRVGAETREWEAGRLLIFDDSFEHEAWNRSSRTRVILLFEIWRPEIGMEERQALTHLFQSIDRYAGSGLEAL